ncbi:MAG: hypothetical protein R3D69_12235 [Xanthobacteraceae bacterium]
MTDRIYNVLFLCTGNSAGSILDDFGSTLVEIGQLQGAPKPRPSAV